MGQNRLATGASAGTLLATLTGQMALARLLKAGLPEILARGLVSSDFGQHVQPTAPEAIRGKLERARKVSDPKWILTRVSRPIQVAASDISAVAASIGSETQ